MSDKSDFRRDVLARRDAIPPEVRTVKSRLIKERIFGLEEFNRAATILLFASFRSEVDTMEMVRGALSARKVTALPVVDRQEKKLLLYTIKEPEELAAGYGGIPEPTVRTEERIITAADLDLIIVPGAAFDLSGRRIGYGGGYYDRLLAGKGTRTTVAAPAFEEQIVEAVPAESHDMKIDILVTDRRIVRF